MLLVVCVPFTIAAFIHSVATDELVEFNITCTSLVDVTPLTDTVYVYGELYPDQFPLESVIFAFLYLSALLLKLLFRE